MSRRNLGGTRSGTSFLFNLSVPSFRIKFTIDSFNSRWLEKKLTRGRGCHRLPRGCLPGISKKVERPGFWTQARTQSESISFYHYSYGRPVPTVRPIPPNWVRTLRTLDITISRMRKEIVKTTYINETYIKPLVPGRNLWVYNHCIKLKYEESIRL